MAILKTQADMAIMKTQYQYDPTKWDQQNPESMVQYFHRELREQRQVMEELTYEMTNLKGFYGWLMHAYPETLIQYKAIQELQRAAEGERSMATEIPRSQP